MKTLHEQVMALHQHYNQVAELQRHLPLHRPRHNQYGVQEQQVRDKLFEVLLAACDIPYAGTGYQTQVENIMDGCYAMRDNPYQRLGGTD